MLCGKFKAKQREKEVFVYEQYAPSRKLKIHEGIVQSDGKNGETDSACDIADRASTLSGEPVKYTKIYRSISPLVLHPSLQLILSALWWRILR